MNRILLYFLTELKLPSGPMHQTFNAVVVALTVFCSPENIKYIHRLTKRLP